MKPFALFLAVLLSAAAAFASDVVANNAHKHYLKTSRSAECDTPTGKTSRQCMRSGTGTKHKSF